MSQSRTCLALAICWVLLSLLAATGSKATVSTDVAEQAIRREATSESLGGADRCLTFISTDKPIYRSGDKVYIRGVMLDANNHKPLDRVANAFVQIQGPKGDVVASQLVYTRDSVWALAWQVPDGQAGGEYSINAIYPQGYAPAVRKFDVRAYRVPRLNSQITFLRDGYGPGEKVTATLDVKRAEGGVPVGAKVTVNARVDGMPLDGGTAIVDAKGLCTVRFLLPRKIDRGEGTLALVIQDGGVVETASKTIPILLQSIDIQMFPEGGDLVSGFKNRVYVQATQPNGKPADLTGNIFSDEAGHQNVAISQLRTEHEGRGRFEFTPDAKRNYFLRVVKPAGINKIYPLPKIRSQGATIRAEKDTFKKDEPIVLQIGSTHPKVRVTVVKREIKLASGSIDFGTRTPAPKQHTLRSIVLPVNSDADGVLTATVWDEKGVPIAERLIFREQAHPIVISVKPDKNSYVPGENAQITVKTTDPAGKPVSAVVGVAVTDESVLQMVEKREQSPRLPVMVFLEPEVKDLADAHVYLNSSNPKAPLATDLLLGTQGWRRFALLDIDKFIQGSGDAARRALAFKQNAQPFSGAWSGVPIGAGPGRPINARIGERGAQDGLNLQNEVGRVEVPRDMNMFQVEPLIIDERRYTSGRAERRQKTNPISPPGAPRPDLRSVDRYTFFCSPERVAVLVREFAHQVRKNRAANDRVDFAETLYWNAGVKTDATTGEATITFGLNDSITTFKLIADAFTNSGSVGSASLAMKAIQPFYAEAKLPLEVTSGDRILLPISLINATSTVLKNADVGVKLLSTFKLMPILNGLQQLSAWERARCIQPIDVGFGKGLQDFVLTSKAGPYQDTVVRQLSVKPKGFPVEQGFGGLIAPDKPVRLRITIEKNLVPESMVATGAVYPSPLANLTAALERMILDPHGCFEQTSSTSYPLTMAQQYFLSHAGIDPKLVETSREKLEKGYKQLVSFWCPDRGYEWFGQNPGHEALTAFGLLHFTDMLQVRDVDRNMVATTRAWLMKQKDGKGGFTRKRRSLHTWIEDKDCSNAYILWALLETGESPANLKVELESLQAAANASRNNYVVALAANAFYLSGDKALANKLMHRLAAMQQSDGRLTGITSSVVGSGGESLEVEGTALATLAWLRVPKFAGNVEKSIKFIADSCKGGRFGSTQATVLSLRAIVAYDKQRSAAKAPGRVHLYADGRPIGDWIAFDESSQESLKLPDLSEQLVPGEHNVEIRMEGGSPMPFSLAAKYNILSPKSDKSCKLNLGVSLAQDKVAEGASTEARVVVTNISKDAVPTPVAIVGLPGGLEPRHDQLKELVKQRKIDAYEVLGREVVLYWRALPGNAKVQIPLSLIASVPGNYTGPASRAYLYYTDEHKKWADGLHVEIAAKK